MKCNHDPEKFQEICETLSCPTCYYEEMMSSKDRAKEVELEVVYDPHKHMKVIRKVK